MGTEVGVWLWSEEPGAGFTLDSSPDLFEEMEQELSRFRSTSGLSRLNAAAGRGPQRVSAILAEVCQLALDAADQTQGLFDPTVLPALKEVGYDDSFTKVSVRPDPGPVTRAETRPHWREVTVRDGMVTLPAGTALDLGGIAKGWAADRVAEILSPWGAVLVDAGGDIRARGLSNIEPWPIAISHPFDPEQTLLVVELSEDAVVTSSVGKRRWQQGGQWMHHLIDPRTQLPSASDVHTVSVVGESALAAEISSKVVLLLGMSKGAAYLAAQGQEGILFSHEGGMKVVGPRLEALLVRA